MQNYKVEIDIMPLEALLDPQGKAVTSGLKNLGLHQIDNVRIGKHITMQIEAENESNAVEIIENACKKLLVNEVMEDYTYTIHTV